MKDPRAGDTENRTEAAAPASYHSLDLTWIWRAPLACLETELGNREAAWDGVAQAPELDLWSLRREIATRTELRTAIDLLRRLNQTQ